MKLFFDTLPIIVFFIAYYSIDIFAATAAAIFTSSAMVGWMLLKGKKPETMHWITLGMIVVLGGATLFFRNEMFIKWKPTAVYWLLGLAFLASQYVGQKPLVRRMLEKSLELPRRVWGCLNLSWASFFIGMGLLNLFVVYNFDTDVWVNFKLFGSLGLTLLFVLGQGVFLMRYMPESNS